MTDALPDLTLKGIFPPPTLDAWRAVVERDLKGADFAKRLVHLTDDGIAVQPLYTEADRAPSGSPGAAPFTRGAFVTPEWQIEVAHRVGDDPSLLAQDLADGANAIRFELDDEVDLRDLIPHEIQPTIIIDSNADGDAALEQLEVYRGSLGLDPLSLLARGTEVDLDGTLRQLATWTEELNGTQTAVEVATHVYHDAGASVAQDLGAALASGVAYLRALEAGGLDLAEAARHITFSVSLGCHQPEAISKLRALRRCWTRVQEACGIEPRGARIHSRTAWRELSLRDPWVNLLRATLSTFAGAVGGAERITALPHDALLASPTPLARRLARNLHHILVGESHLARIVDPAGGSYFLERLTEQVAAAAWQELQAIEGQGGMAAVIRSGWWATRIAAVADARALAVARRKQVVTGISDYPLRAEPCAPARPPLAGAFPARRLAAPFEALRDRADAGARPVVFLAALGSLADHTARSTWITNLLAAGGIDASLDEAGYADAPAAAAAFTASGASVAIVTGSDAGYAEHAQATAAALRQAGARRVVLAGRPGDDRAALEAAGVAEFVHLGVDVLAFLERVWEASA